MARYYDDRPIRQRHSLLEVIAYILIFSIIGITLYVAWPALRTRIAESPGRAEPQATVRPTRMPYRDPAPEQPVVAPADAIADYNATAEAQYQQAIQRQAAPAPIPNVDNTNDSAPLQYVSKPAPERLPSADNVPTAAPIPEAQSSDQFGSKPAAPINVQETHQCLHGQVWTDSGCHRPTPTQ